MKSPSLAASAVVCAALLLAPPLVQGQPLPRDPAERARIIAQVLEANARQLTLFDRRGQAVGTVGLRDLYNQPVLSPDAKRVAVVKPDLDKETNDLWVIEVATAKATQITTSKSREGANSPAWSPDGGTLAYVALRDGYFGVYRKPLAPGAQEELLFKNSAPLTLTDWSQDGRYLVLLLDRPDGRRPLRAADQCDWRTEADRGLPEQVPGTGTAHVTGRAVRVVRVELVGPQRGVRRPVRSSRGTPASGAALMPQQISDQGGMGMAFWRRDGKELFYLAADRGIMAVEIGAGAPAQFGKPKVLFRPAAEILTGVAPNSASVSRDGERFIIAVPRPQVRQLTVYDRKGTALSKVGAPGFYVQPNLSPDGTRAVLMRNDPQTGNQDIWVIDLASGKGTAITSDVYPENAPIWSPDGKQVAYVSTREGLAGIYRKSADGTGEAELIFQYTPGAGMVLTDWSPDGKYMTFFTGVLVLVPMDDAKRPQDRKEIDWLREDYDVGQGRFSPDNRFLAYLSNEDNVERGEVYVRPFDPNKPDAPPPGAPVRVSKDGTIGMLAWRQDGKELYFMTRNWEVMAVDVTTTPTFTAGTPRLLFALPGPLPGNPTAVEERHRRAAVHLRHAHGRRPRGPLIVTPADGSPAGGPSPAGGSATRRRAVAESGGHRRTDRWCRGSIRSPVVHQFT